eukprot:364380-Chlamydomonas_euryale.AAC.2
MWRVPRELASTCYKQNVCQSARQAGMTCLLTWDVHLLPRDDELRGITPKGEREVLQAQSPLACPAAARTPLSPGGTPKTRATVRHDRAADHVLTPAGSSKGGTSPHTCELACAPCCAPKLVPWCPTTLIRQPHLPVPPAPLRPPRRA